MKVLVTALHIKNELFGRRAHVSIQDLHKTHIKVASYTTSVESTERMKSTTDVDAILSDAFNHFNWIQNEGMYAGELVNDICRFEGTHASMSVDDIIKVQYKSIAMNRELTDNETITRYFLVMPIGFLELEQEN